MKVEKQVRELRKQGFNKGEIAGLAGINRATVAKYLKEDFNPANSYYNTTIPSKIKPYAEAIKTMLSEGKTFKQIGIIICEKGYAGSDAAIRMFATRERKIMKEKLPGKGVPVKRLNGNGWSACCTGRLTRFHPSARSSLTEL